MGNIKEIEQEYTVYNDEKDPNLQYTELDSSLLFTKILLFLSIVIFNQQKVDFRTRLLFFYLFLRESKQNIETIKIKDIDLIHYKIDDGVSYEVIRSKDYKTISDSIFWSNSDKKMKKNIKSGKYKNRTSSLPLITKDNILIDGNHRIISLVEKYGDDYEIKVAKLSSNYVNYMNLMLLMYPLTNGLFKGKYKTKYNFIYFLKNKEFEKRKIMLTDPDSKKLYEKLRLIINGNKNNKGIIDLKLSLNEYMLLVNIWNNNSSRISKIKVVKKRWLF